jgi:hypothetical protein
MLAACMERDGLEWIGGDDTLLHQEEQAPV